MADPRDVARNSYGEGHEHADLLIGRLAERQYGVVSRRQLSVAGLTRDQVDHRIRTGRLHCLFRGVYAVGQRVLVREARWMAAVLAAGPGAVLSHRSAAALWGIRAWRGVVDITIPSSRRPRAGVRWHVSRLPSEEVTLERRIPVTTVPRTLLDLATLITQPELERALNQAEVLRLTDPLPLPSLVARYPRRNGVSTVRKLLKAGLDGGVTRSELEERFLPFLQRNHLPRPEVNAPIHLDDRFVEADCLWRRQRVIVELDSRSVHGTEAAFESDRARDRALAAQGWRVVRVTWRHLHDEPDALAADLRALLGS